MEKLKPCPWCATRPNLTWAKINACWNLLHRCPAIGVISTTYYSEEQAIECWNTRRAADKGEEE